MEAKALKCPSCGASLEYDGKSQFVRCDYCGTEIALEGEAPQETQDSENPALKYLEMREKWHEERHERHEKHREERRNRFI